MTISSILRPHTLLIAACALTAGSVLSGQSAAGVMPTWADLESWSRPIVATRQVEHGLGLQVPSAGGIVMMSFSGRVDSRSSTTPASDVMVVIAPPPTANPNVVRTLQLRLLADPGTNRAVSLDLSGSLVTDDPAPGAIVRSATGTMRAVDFVKIAAATSLKGNAFGSELAFSGDQVKAMLALARRLRLPIPTAPQ